MAKLIFLGEKFAGRVYEFAVEKTTVGRGNHNTLTIQDASVSDSHCEILLYGTEVIVRDLGSSNGTVVDGRRLHNQEQHPLDNGQIVKFGSVEARLELTVESESDTVTGWTGFHSYARLTGKPGEAKPAATANLESPPTPAKDDNAQVAAHSAEIPKSAENVNTTAPRSTTGLVITAAAIVIGVVVICWLILTITR